MRNQDFIRMPNLRAVYQVWYRNFKVWQKLASASLLGNVIDPLMALMAFGLGLGSMIAELDGRPYLHFLALGALCMSAMNAATFESLYSAFSRMHVQKTWDSIMNTPVRLPEIVLGEWLWAGTKATISASAMMIVVASLGVGNPLVWFVGLFLLVLTGLLFAALGLCVNAKAPGYDFFMFYFTLFITPQTFLSGAFFPRSQLPTWLDGIAQWMPLSVSVDAIRSLQNDEPLQTLALSTLLFVYMCVAIFVAIVLSKRRFLKRG